MKPASNGPFGVFEMKATRISQVREKFPRAAIIRPVVPGSFYRIFGTIRNVAP